VAKRKKSTRRARKGRVPPQLRPYLFKKGHGKVRRRARRRNPGRKRRRAGAGLRVAEQRITTVKRRKNPGRRRRSPRPNKYRRMLRAQRLALVAVGPGGKHLHYNGAGKLTDQGRPKLYRSVAALKTAAKALRRRYGQVLARYSLYAKTMTGK
jgi:hypothetical protein